MHEATDQTRAPRLTDNRLDDLGDLAIALQTLDDEIEYLADTIGIERTATTLKAAFQRKHDALVRARQWISRKVAAVRAQRGGQ